jgi:SPP1 gp7 family putative phage head morphogenesis protein
MSTITPGAVPFDEAIAHFRAKLALPTETWRSIAAEANARAFVVAGVRDMAALAEIRTAIDRALAEGRTLAEFRTALTDIIGRTGLTLRGEFGWRSRTIFETNLRTAAAAGRWAQIQRLKQARPYLRYVSVLDNRTRPQHRAWHGTVLPVDHPFWATHYPPNGWGCRCTVQSLSERDLRRYGYAVTDPPPPSGRAPRSIRAREGNRIVELPPGIDEGWDYNVGQAAADVPAADALATWSREGEAAWQRLAPSAPVAAPAGPPPLTPAPALPAPTGTAARGVVARAALGGETAALPFPTGQHAAASASALAEALSDADAAALPLLAPTLAAPGELWASFERHTGTGRVVLRLRALRRWEVAGEPRLVVVQLGNGRIEALRLLADTLAGLAGARVGQVLAARAGLGAKKPQDGAGVASPPPPVV